MINFKLANVLRCCFSICWITLNPNDAIYFLKCTTRWCFAVKMVCFGVKALPSIHSTDHKQTLFCFIWAEKIKNNNLITCKLQSVFPSISYIVPIFPNGGLMYMLYYQMHPTQRCSILSEKWQRCFIFQPSKWSNPESTESQDHVIKQIGHSWSKCFTSSFAVVLIFR